MRSYKAEIGKDGKVRLREPLTLRGRHRAVVTVLEPLETDEAPTQLTNKVLDWQRFAGIMKDTPHFNGDPVVLQKAMRDEWD